MAELKRTVEYTHTVEWSSGSLTMKLLDDGELAIEMIGDAPASGRVWLERDDVRQLVESFEARRKSGWSD